MLHSKSGRFWGAEIQKGQHLRKWAFKSVFIEIVYCNKGRIALWAAASLSTDFEPILFHGEMFKAMFGVGDGFLSAALHLPL